MDYKCLSSNNSRKQSKYFCKCNGLTFYRIDDFKNNQGLTNLAHSSKLDSRMHVCNFVVDDAIAELTSQKDAAGAKT